MSIFSDFTDAASEKFSEAVESVAPRTDAEPNVNIGGSLFNAIYQYGRGRADLATQEIANRFRKTKTGQGIEKQIETERIKEFMPFILLAGALILGLIFLRR